MQRTFLNQVIRDEWLDERASEVELEFKGEEIRANNDNSKWSCLRLQSTTNYLLVGNPTTVQSKRRKFQEQDMYFPIGYHRHFS